MDYYKILGVEKTATPDDIKKAYRKLASKHHPDRGGDTATFQQIQEAYSVLSDPNKKNQYDNLGRSPFNQSNFNQSEFNDFFDFNNFFSDFFHTARQQQQRQTVYRTVLEISLLESYNGVKKMLELQLPNGKQIIDIEIPKGIKDKDQLRCDNKQLGIDNLLITISVQKDLRFERRGNDLYSNYSIDVLDLITGCSVPFTTIDGRKLQVQIKPKTQPFMQIKIPNCGMPVLQTPKYGDQYLLLKPFVSDNISPDIIECILKHRGQ